MAMAEKADVVIIGGGAVGASIAYHLAQKGCRDVVVVERYLLGSGSTGKSVGGIRQQFSTEINIRLSQESVKFFERFQEETGVDPEFHRVGYLFLATTPAEMEAFSRNVSLQRRLGVPMEVLTPEQAREMVPALNISDVLGATYGPADGYAGVHEVTQGFARRARQLGVRIYEGREVTGIGVNGGRVQAVETAQGPIATPIVVNAAGAWSGQVARMVGLDLPVQPYRRMVFVTEPFPAIPSPIPLTIEFRRGLYFRHEGPGILMGMADPDEPSSFNTEVNWDFLPRLVQAAVERMPILEAARIKTGWAGLYEVTPDAHPILGPVPALQGFIVATGFSGHGFMHSPATGKLIAELIVDGRATTIDISPLGYERFARGELVRESRVV